MKNFWGQTLLTCPFLGSVSYILSTWVMRQLLFLLQSRLSSYMCFYCLASSTPNVDGWAILPHSLPITVLKRHLSCEAFLCCCRKRAVLSPTPTAFISLYLFQLRWELLDQRGYLLLLYPQNLAFLMHGRG